MQKNRTQWGSFKLQSKVLFCLLMTFFFFATQVARHFYQIKPQLKKGLQIRGLFCGGQLVHCRMQNKHFFFLKSHGAKNLPKCITLRLLVFLVGNGMPQSLVILWVNEISNPPVENGLNFMQITPMRENQIVLEFSIQ